MIHIEIKEGYGGKGHYSIRIGDIVGSTVSTNITEKELIDEIKEELKNLTKPNNDFKKDCKKCEMEVRYKCKEKNEVDMVKDCPYNPS